MMPLCALAQDDISLDGKWQFWVPEHQEQVEVTVPHTYNVMEGLEDYAGEAFYSRTLPATPMGKGRQTRICFRGVYHDASVYVNDQLVGEHLNAGYTPFSFDLTPYLNNVGTNTVTVRCNNAYSEENLPWLRKFDWANDGGIYRSVSLHTAGPLSLRYVHVTPDIELSDSTAAARFDIRLYEEKVRKATFSIRVTENATGRLVYEGQQSLKASKEGVFSTSIDCGRVRLWHFDDPQLYTFDVKVLDHQTVSDRKQEHFGFRTFRLNGNRFELNGELVRLPGIENMPGSNPDFGMAESEEYMAKTIRRMKDLNCTLTRYHWAQDEARIALMDSLGILVQEEISWWQGPQKELTPALREVARRQLQELIEAHYNHPAIWAWGMSNEVWGNYDDIHWMADFTRQLDPTRIVDVCCNHFWELYEKDPSMTLDLPTWNEYVGTWHAKHRDQLPGFMEKIEPALQGRPLLITEAGLCEPAFTGGDARRVDEMIYHMAEWKRHDYVCGYIYFCLEDYRTQMGEEGLGRDRIRRHGVCDKRLEPKASYHILSQLMCPVNVTKVKPAGQQENQGTLANLYEVNDANRDAEITIEVKQDIPTYTLRGYRIAYCDINGALQTLPLPTLKPGDTFTFVMKNVNKGYNFDIQRQDGSTVLKY